MIGKEVKKALDALTPSLKPVESLDHSNEIDLIELDELEIEAALKLARETKFYLRQRTGYNEKLRKQHVARKYTSAEILEKFEKYLDIDDNNRQIVTDLCKYFAEEKCKLDPAKGILLVGGVGIGKSTMMQFFSRNQVSMYRLISCREIESDFSSDGEKSVQNCSYNIKVSPSSNEFCHMEMGYCFDDLGTEANGKHYGKEKNVMAEIILNRYDNQIPFTFTHITTNLTAQEIEDQYGNRVTDRMKQMFNIVTFHSKTPSRRK